MDIEQLIAFERIAREGSFSKAAWLLGIAQPTISARIQGLEREVGGMVFKRGRKMHANPFLSLRWWQAMPMAITRLVNCAKTVADVLMDTSN